MRHRVSGTDDKTKKPIELVIDAADVAAARADAASRGITVDSVDAIRSGGLEPSRGPVVVRLEAGQVVLIERTAKRWKGLLLLSLAALLIGVMIGGWFLLRDPRSVAHPPLMALIGAVLAAMGLAGVVMARVGAWWGHG